MDVVVVYSVSKLRVNSRRLACFMFLIFSKPTTANLVEVRR